MSEGAEEKQNLNMNPLEISSVIIYVCVFTFVINNYWVIAYATNDTSDSASEQYCALAHAQFALP